MIGKILGTCFLLALTACSEADGGGSTPLDGVTEMDGGVSEDAGEALADAGDAPDTGTTAEAPGATDAGAARPSCAVLCAQLATCFDTAEPVDLCPGAGAGALVPAACVEACESGWSATLAFETTDACSAVIEKASAASPELAAQCTGHYPTTPGCDALGARVRQCAAPSCPAVSALGAGLDGFLALMCSDPLQNSPNPDAARLATQECSDPELAAEVTSQLEGTLARLCEAGPALPAEKCQAACDRMAECFSGSPPGLAEHCPTACALSPDQRTRKRHHCVAMARSCAQAERCVAEDAAAPGAR